MSTPDLSSSLHMISRILREGNSRISESEVFTRLERPMQLEHASKPRRAKHKSQASGIALHSLSSNDYDAITAAVIARTHIMNTAFGTLQLADIGQTAGLTLEAMSVVITTCTKLPQLVGQRMLILQEQQHGLVVVPAAQHADSDETTTSGPYQPLLIPKAGTWLATVLAYDGKQAIVWEVDCSTRQCGSRSSTA